MKTTQTTIEKRKKDRAEKLAWILREWDCKDLEEAKKMAQIDKELHYALREVGVIL